MVTSHAGIILQHVRTVLEAHGADRLSDRELLSRFDQEHYRAPLVLCCLENCTRDEAARQLGWSVGTFRRRLERGRQLLRERLLRRGVAPALLAAPNVPTTLPADLLHKTIGLVGGLAPTLAPLAA